MIRTTLFFLCFASLFACGDRPAFDSYDRSCETDVDCVLVEVSRCRPCSNCGDGAISVGDLDRFIDEQATTCFPPPAPAACGPCPETRVSCDQGQCVLILLDGDGITELERRPSN